MRRIGGLRRARAGPAHAVGGAALAACLGCGPSAPPPGPLPEGAPIVDPATPPAPGPTAGRAPDDARRRRFDLGLPDQPWALQFDWDDGLEIVTDECAADGASRTVIGVGAGGRATLSVWLQQAGPADRDAVRLRDRVIAQTLMHVRSPVESEAGWVAGAFAWAEWVLPTIRGIPVRRLERHGFAVHDGWALHVLASVERAGAPQRRALDAWAGGVTVAARTTLPPVDALAFGRACLASDAPGATERAADLLATAAAGRTALTPDERRRLGLDCTRAWLACDRVADLLRLLDALLAEAPTAAHLHYARARACARAGRLDDWRSSLEAAFAHQDPAAPLPDPREDPEFLAIDDAHFDAAMRAIGRGD